jgi:hypothetical protein
MHMVPYTLVPFPSRSPHHTTMYTPAGLDTPQAGHLEKLDLRLEEQVESDLGCSADVVLGWDQYS